MKWRVLLWHALCALFVMQVHSLVAFASQRSAPSFSARSSIAKPGKRHQRYLPAHNDYEINEHTARSKESGIVAVVEKPKASPGMLMKAAALSTLVIQNSALTISLRLSHINSGPMHYISSTAVLVSEVLKLTFATIAYLLTEVQTKPIADGAVSDVSSRPSLNMMMTDIFGNSTEMMQSSIPAGLYVLQNNLQFVATSNLPADVYQVLIQMKLITTALFAKIMMDKTLRKRQWGSIFFLFVGIALVQISLQKGSSMIYNFHPVIGLSSVFLSCLTSGFAGIYYEKTLKQYPRSLWLRNIQLCTVSIVLAAATCLVDYRKILQHGFFQGYNMRLLRAISLQAAGGVLTSIVVKNTSSIAKGFATSASIILSCILSAIYLKESEINVQFVLGAALVCISTIVYSKAAMRKPKQPSQQ